MHLHRSSFLAPLLVLACAGLHHANAAEAIPPPTSPADLEARIAQILADHAIPGAAIAVVDRDGTTWTAGVGLADIEHATPVTPDTLFRLGSCGKSVLGLAFARLAESGAVDLDTPVHDIAPEIAIDNPWRDTDPVRIVHLLEHTAGFDDLHFNEIYTPDGSYPPLEESLALNPASRRVRWRPGTIRSYSSPGYAVAGYVLEKLTGQPYELVLEQQILRPLGMTDTGAGARVDLDDPDLAQGYLGDPPRPIPRYSTWLRPAGDIDSSAVDMGRFLEFLLHRGRVGDTVVISEAGIERAETPATGDALRAGLRVGYGLGIGRRFQDGVGMFGHNGAVGGFFACYWYDADAGVGFAVMVNSGSGHAGLQAIRNLVWSYVTRDLRPEPPPPPYAATTAELGQLAGSYALVSQRIQVLAPVNSLLAAVKLTVEDGSLVMHELGDDPTPLVPVSSRLFRKPDEPEATVAFANDDDGRMTLFARRDEYRRTAAWWTLAHRGFVAGSLLLLASTLVYGIIWVPWVLYRKLRRRSISTLRLAVRLPPLLAAVSLFGGVAALTGQTLFDVGRLNAATVTFFLGTLLFALFSALSVATVLATARQRVGRVLRTYSVAVSLACLGLTVYLMSWHVIGLRLWAD